MPEIVNTDQGTQYTAEEFTGVLLGRGIRISMDGSGRCLDNAADPWSPLAASANTVVQPDPNREAGLRESGNPNRKAAQRFLFG